MSEATRLETKSDHAPKPPAVRARRPPSPGAVAAALFIGAALSLGACVILFAPSVSFPATVLAALVGAVACRFAAAEPSKTSPREPWGFDAYGLLVMGAVVPALGWVAGPDMEAAAWLFVALLFVLAIHAASGLGEQRPPT